MAEEKAGSCIACAAVWREDYTACTLSMLPSLQHSLPPSVGFWESSNNSDDYLNLSELINARLFCPGADIFCLFVC